MRIDSNQGAQALPDNQRAGNQAAVNANSSDTAGASSALGEDQAQLSGIHVQIQAQVQALVAQAAQLPESSQTKVAALRQAVLSGSYQASPEKVAGALFENLAADRAA
jgi:flagellar biosynthesis anti-sigma factor FlgM